MELLNLVQSKKLCASKFLNASRSFLTDLQNGNWNGLETFQRQRESILKALLLFDKKIQLEALQIRDQDRTEKFQELIRLQLSEMENLYQNIEFTDARILELIEKEMEITQKETFTGKRNKEILGKFKSVQSNSGEGVDRKL